MIKTNCLCISQKLQGVRQKYFKRCFPQYVQICDHFILFYSLKLRTPFNTFACDDFVIEDFPMGQAGLAEAPTVQNDDDCCDMVLAMVSM